jgi:hypothetical protein
MTIERSPDSENASASIRINREFDSNDTEESQSHPEKQPEPRISISQGIVTSANVAKFRINL